jgi:YD repeat-containing protein
LHLRPGNTQPVVVGPAVHHSYQLYLVGDSLNYSYAQLMLPDGAKVRFNRISPGTDRPGAIMEHTATPTAFYKARMTWNAARPGWDITLVNGLTYQFTDVGHLGPLLIGIRDRVGNQLTVSRSTPGNTEPVTRVTSPNGYWADFSYIVVNTIPLVSQVRDNLGRTVTYGYNGGTLQTVTDAAGGVTEYTWASNRITSIKDPRTIVFLTNEYDAQSRVTKQTQADETFHQFAYTVDGQGKVTQTDVTDPKGNVRRVTFNANGYALTDTQAYGTAIAQTTTYTRDATSNLVTAMTDALERQTIPIFHDSSQRTLYQSSHTTAVFEGRKTVHERPVGARPPGRPSTLPGDPSLT